MTIEPIHQKDVIITNIHTLTTKPQMHEAKTDRIEETDNHTVVVGEYSTFNNEWNKETEDEQENKT